MSLELSTPPPELIKYKLLDEIGHGGMATVYRALDVRLDREVAVKLMHPHLRDNPEAAARFVVEARAVAQLRHHGIVEIYDVSDENDQERFLVAQLVRGPSLRSLLKDHEHLPPEIGACLGVLVCDALAHAHDKGIIHRDVKPENVLVELLDSRKLASVKLTDFGIAKVVDSQGMTSTGQVLGSPAHMAPEQIDGGVVDVRTDIFGLGVLMYECMVGHLPFEGKNPAQLLRRVLEGEYPKPDRQRPTIGHRWSTIIEKSIARNASERWEDAKAFGGAVRKELEAFGIMDPRAELYAYFSDPKVYEAAFVPRLVETLVARAEQARQGGDPQGAAADLNRAVAYCPDDQELLKQLTSLATGMQRRRMVEKTRRVLGVLLLVGFVVGALVLLGRWVRVKSPATEVVAESIQEHSSSAATTSSSTSPVISTTYSASSLPSQRASAPRMTARPLPMLVIPKVHRDVLVRATPGSALVSVDGKAAVKVGFGVTMRLPVGPHSFTFSTPSAEACCQSRTIQVEIVEGDGPQAVSGTVHFRDARLSLVGGPSDAVLECPALGKSVQTGDTVSINMGAVDQFVTCFISGSGIPPGPKSITLRAGQLVAVPALGSR